MQQAFVQKVEKLPVTAHFLGSSLNCEGGQVHVKG